MYLFCSLTCTYLQFTLYFKFIQVVLGHESFSLVSILIIFLSMIFRKYADIAKASRSPAKKHTQNLKRILPFGRKIAYKVTRIIYRVEKNSKLFLHKQFIDLDMHTLVSVCVQCTIHVLKYRRCIALIDFYCHVAIFLIYLMIF